MQISECERLAASYKAKKARGLVDAKFYVANAKEAVMEVVCGEINRLDAAIERGEAFSLVFDDGH